MEDTLWAFAKDAKSELKNGQVLILILMEDTLWEYANKYLIDFNVLS